MLKSLPLCVCAAALALGACGKSTSNNTAPQQSSAAKEAAGDKTIAASVDQNGKFFQAAKAVGLDATLAGPGPYTVLVPSDDAFGKATGQAGFNPAVDFDGNGSINTLDYGQFRGRFGKAFAY